MQISVLQCCELPYRFYRLSLCGLMNEVKSTHHAFDHLGSVKYAELVDPVEKMEIANSPVPITAVLYQKFIILTVTQLAEVTTVKITV